MEIPGHIGIITNKNRSGTIDLWKAGIILLAAFLRVFRLGALTEFLGDQGRTMLVLSDWVHRGVVPLAGPTTLTGQPLGPFFYYFLLPGYLLSQNPVGVSLWMALFGVLTVVVLYALIRRMFGIIPARIVTLLWAVSPLIASADRVIWEPNLVPLFVLLCVYLLYKAHETWSSWVWAGEGVVLGILIQLHYPTVVFVGLTGLYFLGIYLSRTRKFVDILLAGVWAAIGFITVLLPFLWYEHAVGFRDITSIVSVFVGTGTAHVGKRAMIAAVVDYAFRVFGRALPFMSKGTAATLLAGWAAFVVARPSKKNVFITVWLLGGLAGMAMYSGIVYDHYLYFLTPVPFLMLASVLSQCTRPLQRYVAIGLLLCCCVLQLTKTDAFAAGTNDIDRVSAAVKQIVLRAGNSQFSFTIVDSRSFSDLHYRYFFRDSGHEPVAVTSPDFPLLFLACDSSRCPTVDTLTSQTTLPVVCYDAHCSQYYPTLDLARDWSFDREDVIRQKGMILGTLYEFHRK